MKQLKFSEPLPEMILKGKKDTTWRINDDKDISLSDILSLCRNDGTEFAKARVKWIKFTTFGNLGYEDKIGHEIFKSDKEMLDTYSRYYKIKVTPETSLKVIKYELFTAS